MNVQTTPTPSPETQAMLDCLRQAVENTLERKRRLGQYAVFWSGETPIAVGEDTCAIKSSTGTVPGLNKQQTSEMEPNIYCF